MINCPLFNELPGVYTVVLLKATKHAEREQINKSHWLNNVSRAHFIGRERFPKYQFLVFWIFDPLTIFWLQNNFDRKILPTILNLTIYFFLENIVNCISTSLLDMVIFQNRILIHVFSKKLDFTTCFLWDFRMNFYWTLKLIVIVAWSRNITEPHRGLFFTTLFRILLLWRIRVLGRQKRALGYFATQFTEHHLNSASLTWYFESK